MWFVREIKKIDVGRNQSSLPPGFVTIGACVQVEKKNRNGQGLLQDMEEKEKRRNLYGPDNDGTFAMKRRHFTNTALPIFSGAECWFQNFTLYRPL